MSNASEARNIAVELTLPVMRLNLSRQRVPRQTEALHKILRKKRPGNLGQRNAVSSPSSSGSVHLAQVFRVFNSRQLAREAIGENRQFFTHSDRSCRLTVGAREHGNIRTILSQFKKSRIQCLCTRQPYLANGSLNIEGIREVIDVLRGCKNMDQRTKRGKYSVRSENIASCLEAMINVVLDCLHIVAGFGFDLSEFGNGIRVEILRKCTQIIQFRIRDFGCVSNDAPSQQLNHPLNLDKNSGSIECSF